MQTATLQGLNTLIVFGVVVINMVLKEVLRAFVDLEAPESETERIASLTIKLFVALLFNTALLAVIIKGNIQVGAHGEGG